MKNLEHLADNNIIEAVRAHASWQSPAELVETGGILLMAGQNAFPGAFRNCAVRTHPQTPAVELIHAAKSFFAEKKRSFTVLSLGERDQDLEAHLGANGFVLRVDLPSMLTTKPVTIPPLPGTIKLQPFESAANVRDAASVSAEAYKALGLEPGETATYFSQHANLLVADVIGCVAYEDGKPLASAIGIKSEAAFGIYWVGTIPEAQRRNLAGACTAFITNEAFARGASLVTLQASSFGEPVYQRLGYTTYNRFKLFRPGAI